MIAHIVDIEGLIEQMESQIINHMQQFEAEVKLLKEIPGISDTSAAIIIAEIGTDMNQFASSQHLASWAGMAPGNNESAGKKKVPESIQEIIT
jgi:transposase